MRIRFFIVIETDSEPIIRFALRNNSRGVTEGKMRVQSNYCRSLLKIIRNYERNQTKTIPQTAKKRIFFKQDARFTGDKDNFIHIM